MTRLPLCVCLLATLLGVLGLVRPSLSAGEPVKTPRQVLDECLDKIRAATDGATKQHIPAHAAAGVARIAQLESRGAADSTLAKAAGKAKGNVRGSARGALAQINRVTGRCMILLREMGAERGLNLELLAARQAAINDLSDAARTAYGTIDQALASATGG